jgi:hypothetical protein
MFLGLVTMGTAAYILTDGNLWLPVVDFRWLVAGTAILAGLLFLALSTRRKRD